ncbi:MAG: CDP-alcohol phosphatidyltransferase family protein [Flavobacteriaceae bacterium]|nr:CDP-alcohol phosphatidyltransferase family protein [Flavobacteriaceae bacterium]
MSWLKSFNIADWISFYRILAAPILLILIGMGAREIFIWMLLVSYITDGMDGIVARALKISSARGSQLDSYGDQMTLVVALIGLLVFENEFINANYQLILIAFVPYILQMVIAFNKYGKATAFHTYLAKLSAIVQSVFILWLLFFGPVYPLFYLMIFLGVIETIEEIALIYMYDEWVEGVKGIYWALGDKRRLKKNV